VNYHHQGDQLLSRGDDWAEKLAAEIAHLLDIPAARVEFARTGDQVGVVSADVTHGTADLTMGNEVLQDVNPAYPVATIGEVRGYTLEIVLEALESQEVRPPPGTSPRLSAPAVFAGYLVLDALIGNTDRHHENWALLAQPGEPATLAPSYDHATSLGAQLSDADRSNRCATNDSNQTPEAYARKARSRPFQGRPSLVALALRALATLPEPAIAHYRSQLDILTNSALASLCEAIPPARMSQPARIFARRMVAENRRRLVDGIHGRR